jgi:hypothetical protein
MLPSYNGSSSYYDSNSRIALVHGLCPEARLPGRKISLLCICCCVSRRTEASVAQLLFKELGLIGINPAKESEQGPAL